MGDINDFMCEYLSLARYNADFWNGTVFRGKRRVKIWQLERRDREYYKTQHKRRKPGSVRKDVQMLCKGKRDIILAVEIMATLDYSIPARVMDYDAQELRRQIKDIGQKKRSIKQERSSQKGYINNLRKKDRLVPIHTVVLYCGEGVYDGAAGLKEMLDTKGMERDYQKLLQDYHVRIYNLKDLQEENYETSFREIVGVFKRKDSKENIIAYYQENKERFRLLDELSINLMGALIGMNKLADFPQEKGGVDMCKAFEQAKEEGRAEGRQEGREEGRREGSFHALCCLVEKGKLKLKDAASEVGMTEEMFLESMRIAMDVRY